MLKRGGRLDFPGFVSRKVVVKYYTTTFERNSGVPNNASTINYFITVIRCCSALRLFFILRIELRILWSITHSNTILLFKCFANILVLKIGGIKTAPANERCFYAELNPS